MDYLLTFLIGWLVVVPLGLIAMMMLVDYLNSHHKIG
jgi:hypothetical protein